MFGPQELNLCLSTLFAFVELLYFFLQEDIMHRTLTVKEVLTYQASLRLPSSISKEEKKKKVNEVYRRLKSCIIPELNDGN